MTRLALIVALLTACKGAPDPVSLEDFPAAATDALCDWAVACRHVPSDEICRRTLDPRDLDVRRAADAVAAGRMAWDAQAAGWCLRMQRSSACHAPRFSADECRDMTVGLVEEGGLCTSSFECAAGTCADTVCEEACCVGTCIAPAPRVVRDLVQLCDSHDECGYDEHCNYQGECEWLPDEEGEACIFGCAYGDLYCDLATLTCRRYAGLGEACGDDAPCDEAWSWCVDAACALLPVEGEPCAGAPRCVGGAFCEMSAEICRAPGNGGEPCATPAECEIACVEMSCVEYKTCPEGTAP